MKTRLLFALCLLAVPAGNAGPRPIINSYNALPRSFFLPYLARSGPPGAPLEIPKSLEQMATEEFNRRMEFAYKVRNPWRTIYGQTNLVIGQNWFLFHGRVAQVLPNGILVNGFFDPPFSNTYPGYNLGDLFFVEGFPFSMAEGDSLGANQNWMGKLVGTFTYLNVSGASTTLRKLVYGEPCDPPLPPQPTAEDLENQRAKAEAKASEAQDKVLKFHKDLAAKGDPYGEYQMGLRYLRGDGVIEDRLLAREMFAKAAAQGHQDAAAELAKLPKP